MTQNTGRGSSLDSEETLPQQEEEPEEQQPSFGQVVGQAGLAGIGVWMADRADNIRTFELLKDRRYVDRLLSFGPGEYQEVIDARDKIKKRLKIGEGKDKERTSTTYKSLGFEGTVTREVFALLEHDIAAVNTLHADLVRTTPNFELHLNHAANQFGVSTSELETAVFDHLRVNGGTVEDAIYVQSRGLYRKKCTETKQQPDKKLERVVEERFKNIAVKHDVEKIYEAHKEEIVRFREERLLKKIPETRHLAVEELAAKPPEKPEEVVPTEATEEEKVPFAESVEPQREEPTEKVPPPSEPTKPEEIPPAAVSLDLPHRIITTTEPQLPISPATALPTAQAVLPVTPPATPAAPPPVKPSTPPKVISSRPPNIFNRALTRIFAPFKTISDNLHMRFIHSALGRAWDRFKTTGLGKFLEKIAGFDLGGLLQKGLTSLVGSAAAKKIVSFFFGWPAFLLSLLPGFNAIMSAAPKFIFFVVVGIILVGYLYLFGGNSTQVITDYTTPTILKTSLPEEKSQAWNKFAELYLTYKPEDAQWSRFETQYLTPLQQYLSLEKNNK